MNAMLARIFVYPVKSLRAVEVEHARAGPAGLELDREWMIVDARGRVITLLDRPRLALVDQVIDADVVRIHAAGMPVLALRRAEGEGRSREVRLFRRPVPAVNAGPEADRWFSTFLDMPCSVVRRSDRDAGTFANSRPYHLVTAASVADVAGRIDSATITAGRFRPNFFVTGPAAFDEDRWTSLTIGAAGFRVIEPTARCPATCVDPATATAGAEPLRTLRGYRSVRSIAGRRTHFGVYLDRDSAGTVTVAAGDVLLAR